MTPKISIVLPVYNGEKYLSEAIESVIKQTFSDWELILVDDGSSDKTIDIFEYYEKKDRRIRVIKNAGNIGLPESLNRGFAEARGEYFTWTSCDNCYKENALSEMHTFLDDNIDVSMVYAGYTLMKSDGSKLYICGEYEYENLMYRNIIGACFLYRRSIANRVGKYDVDLFLAEDWDYWLRIYQEGIICGMDCVLYYYRTHDNSLTARKQEAIKEVGKKLKTKHIDYFINEYKDDPEILIKLFVDYYSCIGFDEKYRQFGEYLPILNDYCDSLSGDVMIFGAGAKGIMAYEKYGHRIKAYVDNDKKKVGKTIFGIPIISFEEMLLRNEAIVLALSEIGRKEIIYQMYKSRDTRKFTFD
jgi:glycosyltransferase involved in cell wall biosynthesis